MAEKCVPVGCVRWLRISKQDRCTGEPIRGAGNGALISCQRNALFEARIKDAVTSTFESDCGESTEYTIPEKVLGYNFSFEIANYAPQLEALLTGNTLLTVGADNVGVIEQTAAGCATGAAQKPKFIVEAFLEVVDCAPGAAATYVRYIVPGVEFGTPVDDKEGSLSIVKFSGAGSGSQANAIVLDDNGPFNDIPVDIVTDIAALPDTFRTPRIKFVDTLVDPSAGLTLAPDTCYIVTVPAATP